MEGFFKVTELDQVLAYRRKFSPLGTQSVILDEGLGRVVACDTAADADLPDFARSTVDGYAVAAASTFGASEANPAYLTVNGSVAMGETGDVPVGPGQAVRIATGGMLPPGADGVVMVEHTEAIDEQTIEVYKSSAPGQHTILKGEDFARADCLVASGTCLRPQEIGLLAAFGIRRIEVYQRPRVGIISTGDEVVPITATPGPGQIRDINMYSLAAQVQAAGGQPVSYGIVPDDYDLLLQTCTRALHECDVIMASGGSSVGMRDFTIQVIEALPASEVLVHGISISPGKPTILAKVQDKPFWGIPGHVTSAMVVFKIVVSPFIEHIGGLSNTGAPPPGISARLNRNLASAQGRVDFVRVRLVNRKDGLWAEPVLGKSGLINTMVKADGLVAIGMNSEGLDKGSHVSVMPL